MKKYIMPRGTGKTTGLIWQSSLTGYPIVCATEQSANYIKDIANRLGIKIQEPISAFKIATQHGVKYDKVLVDNAEWVLQALISSLTNASVAALTMSQGGQ